MNADGPIVVVTGATGFVGQAVVPLLGRAGWAVRGVGNTRGAPGHAIALGPGADWSAVLAEASAVVHLAARVHVLAEPATDPLAEFRRVNVAGTVRLAEQAAAAGVRRFVFVSSIQVNAASARAPVREVDPPAPSTPYARSKWEAEQALAAIGARTGMAVTILRPPLVYGPAVKARFRQLVRWVDRGVPLPLSAVDNRRSLIGIDNLADAVLTALSHPAAANGTFLIADAETPSTAELIRAIALALGRPARLFAVPPGLLRAVGRLAGRGEEVERLVGSLVADTGHIRQALDWRPPHSLASGLDGLAAWYRGRQS